MEKQYSHFTDRDDEDECTWVKTFVLIICGRNSGNPKFKLPPIRNGGEDYVSNSYRDFKDREVQLHDVTINYFIDAAIDHLFNDSESRENTWYSGEVVDVYVDSEDQENLEFFVT